MHGPILIVGAPRCGTTLLRMMLNAHPQIAIPHECRLVYETLRHYPDPAGPVADLEAFADLLLSTYRFDVVMDMSREEVLAALRTCQRPTPPELLGAVYRASQQAAGQPPATRWGDKYVGLGEFVEKLADYFDGSQFIHVVRDARDSIASNKKNFSLYRTLRGRSYLLRHTVGAAMIWRDFVLASGRRAEQLGPRRYAVVRYEQLIERPEEECRRLCEFLGLEYDASMLEYYQLADRPKSIPADSLRKFHANVTKPPTSASIGRGTKELSARDLATIQRICGPVMERYGMAPVETTLCCRRVAQWCHLAEYRLVKWCYLPVDALRRGVRWMMRRARS